MEGYRPGACQTTELIAHWKKATQHTVTFIPGEGATFNGTTSVKVDDGAKVTKPSDPTKAGYTFTGWYSGETKWDFAKDTVTSDVTLTAHWTKITQPPTPPTPPTPTPGTEGTGDPEDPGNPEDPYTPGTPGDTKPDTHKTQPQIEFNVDPQITTKTVFTPMRLISSVTSVWQLRQNNKKTGSKNQR